MIVAVVDAVEQRHRPHRREAGGARVIGHRGEHVGERVGARDRHQQAAALRQRAADADAEAHVGLGGREPADPARQARRAHRDRARVDAERARLGHDGDRGEHRVEVRERLAHALEHDAVNAAAGGQARADHVDLLDDLPRGEVARETEPAGRTERTRERAPDLARHACREPAGDLKRDPHGLEPRAIGTGEEVLDERIDRARGLRDQRQLRALAHRAHGVGRATPDRRARRHGLAAMRLRDELARLAEGHADDAVRELLWGHGAQRDHWPTLAQIPNENQHVAFVPVPAELCSPAPPR